MKTLFTFLLAAICFTASAQTDSTVTVSADSSMIKRSLPIQPVIVNMTGDTAYYLHWKAFDVDRADTTIGMNTYVSLLDKTGKVIGTFNCPIPASVVNEWAFDPKPIDDYILSKSPRLKRKQ